MIRGRQAAVEEMERLYLDELMALQDTQEGLDALIEKRKPVWQNNRSEAFFGDGFHITGLSWACEV